MEANDLSSAENSKSSESLPRGRLEGRPLFAVDVSDQATDPQFANVRGQGGKPPSGRCDMEALAGRQVRRSEASYPSECFRRGFHDIKDT